MQKHSGKSVSIFGVTLACSLLISTHPELKKAINNDYKRKK